LPATISPVRWFTQERTSKLPKGLVDEYFLQGVQLNILALHRLLENTGA
jgi:hypothetical protein